jgi:hypothetical protein
MIFSSLNERQASLWRSGHGATDNERYTAQIVTGVMTALFICVVNSWRPFRMFEKGGFSSNFYDAQAAAFLRGQLHVPADIAGIEGFVINSKTYLYYGPFLALVRLPSALWGSWADGRLVRLSMTIGFIVMCAVIFRLVIRIRQILKIEVRAEDRWRPAIVIAIAATSPVLALGGDISVYYETELWAFVFLLTSFSLLLRVYHQPSYLHLCWAGVAVLVTVHTRASVGLGAICALGALGLVLMRYHRTLSLSAIGIAISVFITHIGFHYAKFGMWLNLPGDKQVLTALDPNRAAWFAEHNNSFFSPDFLPTTMFHYLRPDAVTFERLAPFVRFGPEALEFGLDLESYTPSSSLTVSATGLVILALIGIFHIVRRRQWFVWPLVAGGGVAAFPTLAIGFIAQRYLVDFLPVLVVFTAVAVLCRQDTSRLFMRISLAALLFWGAWANSSFAAWLGNIQNPGFTSWRYGLDDKIFNGVPPGVVSVSNSVPRDGVVGIDGNCDGLYIAVAHRWQALELADGVRKVSGTFDSKGGNQLMQNSEGKSIALENPDDGKLVAVFRDTNGDELRGVPVEWDGQPVEVTIVSDPVAGWVERGLRIEVDGVMSLRSLDAPVIEDMKPLTNFVVTGKPDKGTPTCLQLQQRRR